VEAVSCVKAEAELPFDRLGQAALQKESQGSEGVSEMRRVRRENKRRGVGSGWRIEGGSETIVMDAFS